MNYREKQKLIYEAVYLYKERVFTRHEKLSTDIKHCMVIAQIIQQNNDQEVHC